jgi:Xaa-Pro aminopeptidase
MLNLRLLVSVVPSEDAHSSEYTAEADKRREWISKYVIPRFQLTFVLRNTYFCEHSFTGSAGQAIISKTAAYLVTDSRYWLQAEKELDESWVLIRGGAPHGPRHWVDWLTVSVSRSILALGH